MHKDVNWLESASLDMHNYVSWCLRISMRLYFAILGVGKRSLWCAGFTDPPKPSGWYRKYIGNRTIEETSANQKILTSLELIKLIGQYRFHAISLLFVVVIWNGKGKYLWKNFCWPSRLVETFFKKLKFLERNGILIVDAYIPRFIKQRRLYQFS